LIGLLCLALVTERNGNLLDIAILQKLNIHMQAALLLFGLLFTTWGLIGHLRLSMQWRGSRRIEIFAVAAITVLALILRAWRVGSAIHGLIDEAHFINAITLLWQYPDDIRILQPFSNIPAFPWVFPYAQWGGVEIFGNNLTGLRVISVLIGAATVPAVYLLARSLFDKPTALIAALILATFPPHIHFSRAGINNIADPLMGTAALGFLAYGLHTRRRWPFVLAGITLGLTQYFYDGGRLLYPALALLWLLLAHIISHTSQSPRSNVVTLPSPSTESAVSEDASPLSIQREEAGGGDSSTPLPVFEGVGSNTQFDDNSDATPPPPNHRKQGPGGEGHPLRRHLILFALAFLLIATPVYYTRYGQDSGFSSRSQDVRAGNDFWRTVLLGDNGELIYLRHLSYTFLIYIYMPEMSWFYGGHTPLILRVFVPLFLVGLFWAIWNWRKSGPLLLILWLGLVALGNSLLSESATSARYVVVFPALALLMAVGLRQSVALLLSNLWPKRAQFAVISLIAIAIAVTQTGYYFDRHMDAYNNGRLSLDADDVMFRAADLPPNTHIHIVYDIEIMRFNLDTLSRYLHRPDLEVTPMYPERFTSFYLDGLPRDVNHAFFLPPDRYDLVALLVAYFELDPAQYSPYNVPREYQFVLYFAPVEKNTDHPTDELWMRRNNQP
ncbi:MAG: glycosyltransferase family 39 protein, partial [Anaerolineae bacterium]|nr:glycosyltransferase family 39 protein [Anaerolineae bacterium]